MTPLLAYASLLLLFRLGQVYYILKVIFEQRKLLKLPVEDAPGIATAEEIDVFRHRLYYLAIIILVGSFIPIIIDTLTILVEVHVIHGVRRDEPYIIGVMYAFSNAITAMLSASFVWQLYKLSKENKIPPHGE